MVSGWAPHPSFGQKLFLLFYWHCKYSTSRPAYKVYKLLNNSYTSKLQYESSRQREVWPSETWLMMDDG